MATAKRIPEPLTGDPELDAEIESFEKRGNWVEDRKEILKDVTGEEIDAMVELIEAENPEEYLSPEEIWALAEEEAGEEPPAPPAKRRAEPVCA